MNKIETIYNAFNDIKEVLGLDDDEQCVTIEDLSRLVADAVANNGGYTTVFLFSSSSVPGELPVDATMGADGRLSDTGEGWSQDSYETTAVYSRAATNNSSNWMSFARFRPDGTQASPWSTPVDLKGADGRDGRDGVNGENGPQGIQGGQGAAGTDGTRYQYIYYLTNNGDTPPLNKVPYNREDDAERPGDGWSDNPQGVTEGSEYEFISMREKVDGKWSDWSDPILWSHFGVQGKDGNGIEYIFCLTNDPTVIPQQPQSDNVDESQITFPLIAYKDGIKYEWFDDPLPTDNQGDICWSSVRKQKHNEDGTQTWGPYSDAVIWARHSKDGKDGGGRTVQVYTGDENPEAVIATPTGGEWNPETNVVTPPIGPDGRVWTEDMGKIIGSLHIWQSNMPFNGAGTPMVESWSEPFRLTGDDGQPGTDGESIEFIYRLLANKDDYDSLLAFHTKAAENKIVLENTDSDIVPTKIDNFSKDEKPDWIDLTDWQPVNDKYTVCESEWTDSPEGIDGKLYLVEVVCTRKRITVEENGVEVKKWGEWSMPMLWSMWGEDGTDGDGVEYIYCLTPKKDEFGEIDSNHNMLRLPTKTNYEENNWGDKYQENDFVPGRDAGDPCIIFLGNNWTDEPQDVSKEQPVEWVSIRKKRKWNETDKEPTWGDFSTPKRWAMWATDGNSFKTAYAFTCSSLPLDEIITNPSLITGGSYSNPIPNDLSVTYDNKRHTIIWYDTVPSGGSADSIWMVTRSFMSGSADADSPDSIDANWTLPCRMSDRVGFQVEYCRGKSNPDGTFDEEERPYPESIQTYFIENNYDIDIAESTWRQKEAAKGFIWDDYVEGAVWMATSQFNNGKWSPWSVVRIKGEKGDAGENGTSVEIQGTGWIFEMCPGDEGYANFLDDAKHYDEQDPPNYGKLIDNLFLACDSNADGIVDYTLYVWDEVADRYADADMSKVDPGTGYMIAGDLWIWNGHNWYNAGPIKGDPGDPAYLYLAYSNDPVVLEIELGDSDNLRVDLSLKKGKYIGRRVDNIVRTEDFLSWANVYEWSEWIGDDGWGEEQIFLLTRRTEDIDWDCGPDISNLESKQEKNFLPKHNLGEIAKGHSSDESRWSDGPLTPTEEFPFCWVCIREATTKEFKEWKRLALYTRYASAADHLELSEDQITVPVEGDAPDTEWTGADLTATLYAGDTIATRSDVSYSYAINDSEELIPNNGSKFVWDRKFFVDNPNLQKIRIHAEFTVNDVKHEFDKFCRIFWSTVGYELSVDRTILRKDMADHGKLIPEGENEKIIIQALLKKWDFTNNVWNSVKNSSVFAEYTYTDPDDQLAAEEGGFNIDEALDTDKDGVYLFDVTDKHNLEKIKVYATKDQRPTGEIIAFEEIGVCANGVDGNGVEYIYFLTDNEDLFDNASQYYLPDTWFEDPSYQDTVNEYVPTSYGWTDEPSGTSESNPYEFVSARKRKNIDGKMQWTKFSWPILWAKYGRDAGTCNFANPTSIVSFVNKKIAVDRVVDTIVAMKAAKSVQVTKVEFQQVVIDGDVDNPIVSGSPIRINYSREYIGFIFEESNIPTISDGSSFKECIIDVHVRIETTAGAFTAIKSIILQKSGGESNFRIDLDNEFHYMKAHDGIINAQNWPAVKFMAYYGTEMLTSDMKINITATDQKNNSYDLYTSTESISKDKHYWAFPKWESVEDWVYDKVNIDSQYLLLDVTATTTINGKECSTRDFLRIQKTSESKATINVTPSVLNLTQSDTISWTVDLPDGNGYDVNYKTYTEAGYEVRINNIKQTSDSYKVSELGEVIVELWKGDVKHDYEPVTVVSLTNPYLLDLNPDHEYIDTNGEGTNLKKLPSVTLTLWNGSEDVTNDVTFKAECEGCTGAFNGNTWTMSSITANDATVNFTATTVGGIEATKMFKAVKSFGKVYYKLDVPTSINADKISSFDIAIQKVDNENVSDINNLSSEGLTLYVSGEKRTILTEYDISGLIGSSGYSIPIKLYKDEELMDSETIAIVRNGVLDETEAAKLKEAAVTQAQTNIDTAKTALEGQIVEAKTELRKWVAYNNYAAAADVDAQLERLEYAENALTILNGYFNDKGEIKKGVLNQQDVYDLSIASLGDEAEEFVGENGIPADNVWAQNVIALVGKFAEVKAENITGTNIYAKNLISVEESEDTSNKSGAYDLFANGSGQVAYGQIKWDEYGKVTFGDNVTLEWNADWDNKIPDVSNFATTNDIQSALDALDGDEIITKINSNSVTTGKITAARINVDDLTVNHAKATDGEWELKSDGSASFANGQITFSANGNWNLGNGVLKYANGSITTTLETNVPWAAKGDDGIKLEGSFYTASGDIWTDNGNIFTKNGNIAAYNIYGSSDMRLKTPVKDVKLTLDQIADAPAFTFDWNETGVRSLGSSAQYWEEVLPEGVAENPDGHLAMQYGNISLVGLINLANEVRELKAQVAYLQEELKRR